MNIIDIKNEELYKFRKYVKNFVMIKKLKYNQNIYALCQDNIFMSTIFVTKYNKIEINHMYTNINHRNKGYSSYLLKYLINLARSNNFNSLEAYILPNCNSIYIFKNFGFNINGDFAFFKIKN